MVGGSSSPLPCLPRLVAGKEISLCCESRMSEKSYEWKRMKVTYLLKSHRNFITRNNLVLHASPLLKKVVSFDTRDGQHHIKDLESEYQSLSWHRLIGMSFSIYGMKGQHVRYENVGEYREKFKPYTPKDKKVNFETMLRRNNIKCILFVFDSIRPRRQRDSS